MIPRITQGDLFWIIIIWVGMLCSCKQESPRQPNFVVILADDLGYGDLGCYGGFASTPHLDQLAAEGIRFTHFYSAAPNCSPARAGLLTGKDPAKTGVYNYMPGGHPMHLRNEEITIAEIVRQKGYATGHFGKWHLSNLKPDYDLGQPQPHDQGFDYSLGTTNNAHPTHYNPVNFVRNGVKTDTIKGYSCQIMVQEAVQWIKEIQTTNQPFFLYLPFHEPHKKVESPPHLVAKYDTFPELDAQYLASVENIDDAVGRLLKALDTLGLDDHTLFLFASDNGSYRNGSNGPLLGGKSFVYEGGIRVPGIIRWKSNIKPGMVSDIPVNLIDIMPTICSVLDINHPYGETLDGVDISPLFIQRPIERMQPMSWFFYRTSPEIALRIDDLMILGKSNDTTRVTHPTTQPDMEMIENMALREFELYDLSIDPGQENNLLQTGDPVHQQYIATLTARLKELQESGHYWSDLPEATNNKKRKSEWRQLRPTGFSN